MMRHNLKPIIFVLNNSGYTIERYLHGKERKYNDISNWCVLSPASVLYSHPTHTAPISQEVDKAARHARRRGGQERQVVHGRVEAGALRAAREPHVRRGADDPARRAHDGQVRRAARAQGSSGAQWADEPLHDGVGARLRGRRCRGPFCVRRCGEVRMKGRSRFNQEAQNETTPPVV